jgi:methylthioribose-1-phosphate isomerase
LLDQTKLPTEFVYDNIETTQQGWDAIRNMKVRGAPAIALAGVLSVAVDVHRTRATLTTPQQAADFLLTNLHSLRSSRPTAVNLFEAIDRLAAQIQADLGAAATTTTTAANQLIDHYLATAEHMLQADVAANRQLGDLGCEELLSLKKDKPLLTLLTHCNAGALATAGYGTALGVVRSVFAANRLSRANCTETRPFNQGARLTALELVHDHIPATLITDSMAGALMSQGALDAVVVGADRVAANGDTANKIGTYSLAVLCRFHGIPFIVAAPTTTLDPSLKEGSQITIEQRPAEEITHFRGVQVAAPQVDVWNPAFDVTPHTLISAIVTEAGVLKPCSPGAPFDVAGFLKAHLLKVATDTAG